MQSAQLKLFYSVPEIINSAIPTVEVTKYLSEINDWSLLAQWYIERQQGPFLYKIIHGITNRNAIPEDFIRTLQQSWLKNLSRSMVLCEHFRIVVTVLNMNNISVIAMKGIYLSVFLYKELGLRQFSDIDLLVKEDDATKVIEELQKLGYKSTKSSQPDFISKHTEKAHLPAMVKDGVSIEIHTKVHKKRDNYKVDLTELWEQSVETEIHNVNIKVFSLMHQLITVSLHLEKHFISGKIHYNGFYDIVILLNEYGDSIDWQAFKLQCQRWRVESIYGMIYLAHYYFNAKLPEFLKNYKPDNKLKIIFQESLISGVSHENLADLLASRIKDIDGRLNKIRYLLYYLFPEKSYMMQYYKIKNPIQLIYYYPFRWIRATLKLKSIFKILFKLND